jgi:phosphate-selective porin OprO/OprP
MERSLCFDAFIGGPQNGFQPGLQFLNWDSSHRSTWALGVFKANNEIFGWNVGDGEYEVTGRLTHLLYYENDGRCLFHVGLGATHKDPDFDAVRLRARSLLRNGPPTLHTVLAEAVMRSDSQTIVVPEVAMVWGPFNMQAEYFACFVESPTNPITPVPSVAGPGSAYFHGYYVQALYFLTGEHRRYNRVPGDTRRLAIFDRVIPNENFFCVERFNCDECCFGRGGWQIGARYSYIDLNSNGINGGIVHDITLGLNWFWNPCQKVQFNYDLAYREVVGGFSNGWLNGAGVTFRWDF